MKKIIAMTLAMCFALTGCFQTDKSCREKILNQIDDASDRATKLADEAKKSGDLRESSFWLQDSVRLLEIGANFSLNMSINNDEGACDYYFDGNAVRRK